MKVHGTPTVIDLNKEYGATLRIFASSYNATRPTAVSVQFEVEERDFYAAFTATTPALVDRIIMALMKAKVEAFGA